MKTSDRLKKYPRRYWIIPLLVFIIPLFIDNFVRDSVYKFSIIYNELKKNRNF